MKEIIAKIKAFFTSEKQKMEGKSAQEKWDYFMDYYKWWAIAIILVIISIVYTVVAINSQKDIVLSGYLLDSYTLEDPSAVFSSFSEYAQIDTEECAPEFTVNMSLSDDMADVASAVQQRIVATIAAKETDFISAPLETFSALSYQTSDYFGDLREYLTVEQLEVWKDRIFYIDAAQRQDIADSVRNNPDVPIVYPDPHDPESMEDPIPVGIDVAGFEELDALYLYCQEYVYLGIVSNAPHPQITVQFIEYLLG